MPQPASNNLERERLLRKSLSRWDNEGGHLPGAATGGPENPDDIVPPLSNAELVQLQIRVIALENLVVALLADASNEQLERVRRLAAAIFPRPGVEHRLTIQATAQMEHLSQRALRV
ncbi:MAG: hypothetical protein M9919_07380 [Burkholderiaceae bacterium]|jgi:hypothetical protein|nr:hypothetical protein [Burkholderiaceae bacterium]MCO5103812.1 hypothetical protein [Burkholderiaceae bacterium]